MKLEKLEAFVLHGFSIDAVAGWKLEEEYLVQ